MNLPNCHLCQVPIEGKHFELSLPEHPGGYHLCCECGGRALERLRSELRPVRHEQRGWRVRGVLQDSHTEEWGPYPSERMAAGKAREIRRGPLGGGWMLSLVAPDGASRLVLR